MRCRFFWVPFPLFLPLIFVACLAWVYLCLWLLLLVRLLSLGFATFATRLFLAAGCPYFFALILIRSIAADFTAASTVLTALFFRSLRYTSTVHGVMLTRIVLLDHGCKDLYRSRRDAAFPGDIGQRASKLFDTLIPCSRDDADAASHVTQCHLMSCRE